MTKTPASTTPQTVNTNKKESLDSYNGPDLKKIKLENGQNIKKANNSRKKLRKFKPKKHDPTSPLGVLQKEIEELLLEQGLKESDVSNDVALIINNENKEEVDAVYHTIVENVEVLKFCSNGDGLALISGSPFTGRTHRIVTIPFGIPGDVVTIKLFKTNPLYLESDLLEVSKPSSMRDDSLIKCDKYFGKCSGCQYQNIAYKTQLALKRQTIENAYKFFANNTTSPESESADVTPEEYQKMYASKIRDTVGSPLQYDYRTKLTPHFDISYSLSKKLRKQAQNDKNESSTTSSDRVEFERPNLGFGAKGKPTWRKFADPSVANCKGSVLDIEECVIGTPTVQNGLKRERNKFLNEYQNYKKGATILLRENTEIVDEQDKEDAANADPKIVKTCVTNPKQIVVELVDGFKFEFIAGEFFQNNNSILPLVIDHVKRNLVISQDSTKPRYLVDAYCGSGLFSISCSTNVNKVIGVEISQEAVKFATRNSELNKIENCKFIAGEAQEIFKEIDTPADQTSVILDPPRKGCDEVFLKQLSEYKPAKIVYISCNVHSQARDVDWFLKKSANGHLYKIDSIQGFDFFPQTHHVESVCVLSRN
ncbi:hypothetical protein ACO0QE_001333 [Hanseniaspora vineae]